MQWALGSKTLHRRRGPKRNRPTDATLDLSGLSGVTLYEPEELVLSAKAGTPLAEIEALLAANGQQLAFEPMDYGPLLGGAAGQRHDRRRARRQSLRARGGSRPAPRATISSASRAVSGRGETFKSGGRVVKNVTGYDLCKLLAGSWGTLAAMTDVTVKTLPRAETEQTVLVLGLDDAAPARP